MRAADLELYEPLVDAARLVGEAAGGDAHVGIAHPAPGRYRLHHRAQLVAVHVVLPSSRFTRRR
jgi:hypothetical protein